MSDELYSYFCDESCHLQKLKPGFSLDRETCTIIEP